MKYFILFLLLFSVVFATYSIPPVQEVEEHNLEHAEELEWLYDASAAKSGNVTYEFGTLDVLLEVSGNVNITGLSVEIDNSTLALDGLSVIMQRGYYMEKLPSPFDEGICRELTCHCPGQVSTCPNLVDYGWCCDLDSDYCIEYVRNRYVHYAQNVTFTFRNHSESLEIHDNVVEVPEDILDAMKNSSGKDVLEVSILGRMLFIYEINDMEMGFDCYDNYTNVSTEISFNETKNFTVDGVNKLYLLTAPVLREQWSKNNRFNSFILSQSRLVSARIIMNDNETKNISFYEFDIETKPSGLQRIVSLPSQLDNETEETETLATPVQLERYNHSFAFAYFINSSYNGSGENELVLEITDIYGEDHSFSEVILSRMLSYNGTTLENGSQIRQEAVRPSASYKKEEKGKVEVAFGLVALLLILAFVDLARK